MKPPTMSSTLYTPMSSELDNLLTPAEEAWLDTLVVRPENMDVLPPRAQREEHARYPLLIPSLLVDARLSELTRRHEERRLEKLERKRISLRERKPYTRKRGTVHPKKKEASLRRLRQRNWARNPWWCVIKGWGRYEITKADWDRTLGKCWEVYDPAKLTVRRYRAYGTRVAPHTVYSLDVIHAELGKVYNGNNQLLYDLSCPVLP